ncbi:MAG: AI-2E family transporter [Spirochaetia bacterium]|nr:AI-2E family transporter [Spirochaetia bacterium]
MIFLILGIFFLKYAATVLAPLVFAIMISFMLYPLMQFLEKIHIPRTLAVIIIMSCLAVLIYAIATMIHSSLNILMNDYPKYLNQFKDIYSDITMKLAERFDIVMDPDLFRGYDWNRIIKTYAFSISGSFSKIAGYALLIFIFMFFMFLEYPYIAKKINEAFSFKEAKKFNIISGRILQLIGRYFFIKFIISFLTGLEVWFVLYMFNVDFPVIWGCIAFILNFVPTIGSTVVVILITVQGIVQFYPSVLIPTSIFLLNLGIQQLMGNFIEPRIQGSNLNLSPVLILISLAFWAWIWGPLGAVMAVPITVAIRIICYYFDSTRFISILMSTGYTKNMKHHLK